MNTNLYQPDPDEEELPLTDEPSEFEIEEIEIEKYPDDDDLVDDDDDLTDDEIEGEVIETDDETDSDE
jgi:hypothetical protein